MPKEEKPLSYERRILDTKGLAQRLDLNYLLRRHWFCSGRRAVIWIAPLVAALAVVPFVTDLRGSKKVFTSGPVSQAHAVFEKDCKSCHVVSFQRVSDADCKRCHDGPAHQMNASLSDEPRCAECHMEHRGNHVLAEMEDWNCTRCHTDLAQQGNRLRLQKTSLKIRKFAPGEHPAFSAQGRTDTRPLKLNHAAHMPAAGKVIGGIKLPMACTDCHQTAPRGTVFDMVPVSFNSNCSKCHARELEFDLYQMLGSKTPPAPHTKNPRAIRDHVYNAYRKALAEDPLLWRKPLGAAEAPVAASPEACLEPLPAQSL